MVCSFLLKENFVLFSFVIFVKNNKEMPKKKKFIYLCLQLISSIICQYVTFFLSNLRKINSIHEKSNLGKYTCIKLMRIRVVVVLSKSCLNGMAMFKKENN